MDVDELGSDGSSVLEDDEEAEDYIVPHGRGRHQAESEDGKRVARTVYEKLTSGCETFVAGDFAMVELDGGGTEVVRIEELYERDDEDGEYYAWVSWYWRRPGLPDRIRKRLKTNAGEIFLDTTSRDSNEIHASGIDSKAMVYRKQSDLRQVLHDPENDVITKGPLRNQFFCTRTYSEGDKKLVQLPSPSPTKPGGRSSKKRADWSRPFKEAIEKLQLSEIPGKLPRREKQHRELKALIRENLLKKGPGNGVYVSGMPGTGKTATMRQIIRELCDEGLDFRYIETNAMMLPTPKHIYTEIYRQWAKAEGMKRKKKKMPSPTLAVRLLEQMITGKKKGGEEHATTILLIDELDFLLTRSEQVIYTLFDWPTRKHSRMVVVGIANSYDLVEQFTPRVQSRLGLVRIKFPPYNREDIRVIAQARISELEVFDPDALEFCSRKVSSVSGDVRRALQILRRAAMICEEKIKEDPKHEMRLVGMTEIKEAVKVLYESSDMIILSNLGLYQRFVITTLLQYICINRKPSCELTELQRRANQYLSNNNHPLLSLGEIEEVVEGLYDQRVLLYEVNHAAMCKRVRINVQKEDIKEALRNDDELGTLLATIRI